MAVLLSQAWKQPEDTIISSPLHSGGFPKQPHRCLRIFCYKTFLLLCHRKHCLPCIQLQPAVLSSPSSYAVQSVSPILFLLYILYHSCTSADVRPQGTNPYRDLFFSGLAELPNGALGSGRMMFPRLWWLQFSSALILHIVSLELIRLKLLN